MVSVVIRLRPNGPLVVEGDVTILAADGSTIATDPAKKVIAFCRCGQSVRKPFCDGAHNRCGWSDDVTPPPAPVSIAAPAAPPS